ncbi:hypothetical protein HBN50_17230 [Halobacteriovorax sp. GB3]|uniref:hypothetical protein n=1 Tax=Halobacteriovorax sp. GB3 TaxID=2719615 RepID=UPI0023606706|nr:hypothetical protein [Halobacteriovorax sp. GB3]MDD0854850.1 hypothetical protein [Halobacteriovorax sp. GB3]
MKFVLLLFLATQFVGCAELLAQRTFIDEMDRETDGLFVAGRDFNQVPGDSGQAFRTRNEINDRTPASIGEYESRERRNSLKLELRRKLRGLSQKDYQDYSRIASTLENDSERIYYLSLDPQSRREYLFDKGIIERSYGETRGMQFLGSRSIRKSALHLGMGKNDVVQYWGRPVRVDVAGNPSNENERWAFYENGRLQYVYFESGVVQGWALE